jgi:protein TonB
MFEQVFVGEAPGKKRFWTTCVGVTGQVALVASMVVAPMVWPEALPKPTALLTLLLPPVPLPPPPKGPDTPHLTRAVQRHSIMNLDGTINLPHAIPKAIEIVDEAPPEPGGGGVPGGTGVPGGIGIPGSVPNILGSTVLAPPPPVVVARPVEKPAPAPEPARIKTGGVVLEGKLISRVEPPYPPLARQMRVQGVVELLAVVGTDGKIRELKLLSGSPLLAPAAIDAVKRWIYRPTFLNGDPVEIMAPITVTFKLN